MNPTVPLRATALLALSSLAGTVALAETSPYYIGAALAVTRDSNVTAQTEATADTVTTTTLLAGIDQPIGRQRVNLSASVRDNRYANESSQNHYAYNLGARLDWETVDRLSGSVRASADQERNPYEYQNSANTGERSLSKNESLSATARLGVVTRLTLEGTASTRRQEYRVGKAETDKYARNYHFSDAGLSLRYGASPDLTWGLGFRLGDGRYTTSDIDFKRRDIDLLASWRASGASKIDARLSASKLDYAPANAGDLSGLTGNVVWEWEPTGKLKLVSRLFRDNDDTAASFSTSTAATTQSNTSQSSSGLSFMVDYEFSAKINFTASASATRHSLDDTLSGGTTSTKAGRDRLAQWSLGARWTPIRVMTVGCDLTLARRTTQEDFQNSDGSVRNAPFDRTLVGCSIQAVLQ